MRLLTVLLLIGSTALARDLPKRYADCIYNDALQCTIRFNMKHSTIYRLQQFSVYNKRWETISEVSAGDPVDPGYFYRVANCKRERCRYSSLFWAPILLDIEDVPEFVDSTELDGSTVRYSIGRNLPLDAQLSQLNAYEMTGQLLLILSDIENDMSKPPKHVDGVEGFPHAENLIHHNLYEQFTITLDSVRESD